jgi:hypothetical protein
MMDQKMAAGKNVNNTEVSDQDEYRLQMGMAAIGLATLFGSVMEASFVYPPSETDESAAGDDTEK